MHDPVSATVPTPSEKVGSNVPQRSSHSSDHSLVKSPSFIVYYLVAMAVLIFILLFASYFFASSRHNAIVASSISSPSFTASRTFYFIISCFCVAVVIGGIAYVYTCSFSVAASSSSSSTLSRWKSLFIDTEAANAQRPRQRLTRCRLSPRCF